jgi:hypothetical protein
MPTGDHSQQAIEVAEAELRYWAEEVVRAQERVDRELEYLRKATESLQTAKDFVELLRLRYGRGVEPEPGRAFAGMGLRDAAHVVIERKGRAAADEIAAELRAGGFALGDHPRRRLHFALLRSDKVRKVGPGIWQWAGAEQPEMPLATVERHE